MHTLLVLGKSVHYFLHTIKYKCKTSYYEFHEISRQTGYKAKWIPEPES
jgi:hypothetical protein